MTLKVDRFTLLMALVIVFVIVSVGTSQYQQFNLNTVAVQQNSQIYDAIHKRTSELNATEHKLADDIYRTMNNITSQHDRILKFINENTLYSQEGLKHTNNLFENQSDYIIQKLNNHTNTTATNLKLTKINAYYLLDTNRILHEILGNNMTTPSLDKVTKNESG